jgi:hypothetical protein
MRTLGGERFELGLQVWSGACPGFELGRFEEKWIRCGGALTQRCVWWEGDGIFERWFG